MNGKVTCVSFTGYQRWTRTTAIYPGVAYPRMGLAEETGELVGLFAKAVRDGTDIDQQRIIKEAGDVLWMLARVCDDMGVDLQAVVDANIEKLESRRARNVISGEGDDR